jgi:hypothetical protein
MTDIEIRSLKTQIELLKEINDSNKQIIYLLTTHAESIIRQHIQPNAYMKNDQKVVEFKCDDFDKLRVELDKMTSKGLRELNGWIHEYIDSKTQAEKIFNLLR